MEGQVTRVGEVRIWLGRQRLGQRAQVEAGMEGSGCGEMGRDGSIPRGAGG